jgi:hypothetical protein
MAAHDSALKREIEGLDLDALRGLLGGKGWIVKG